MSLKCLISTLLGISRAPPNASKGFLYRQLTHNEDIFDLPPNLAVVLPASFVLRGLDDNEPCHVLQDPLRIRQQLCLGERRARILGEPVALGRYFRLEVDHVQRAVVPARCEQRLVLVRVTRAVENDDLGVAERYRDRRPQHDRDRWRLLLILARCQPKDVFAGASDLVVDEEVLPAHGQDALDFTERL